MIVRRLLKTDLSWLITEILRRQISYLFLKCPEACRYTKDNTPTPGFLDVKNSFDVTKSLLGQLHRELINNHNTDKRWELQANARILTQCLDKLTRERLADDELFQKLKEADVGFISERPIVAVVYSHNNSHQTVQARLTSMKTLQVITDYRVDVNALTDRQLTDMTLYTYNALEDEMVHASKGQHDSYVAMSAEARRKKLEAIETLRHNVAMYNIDNPDAYQTDVDYVHCEWGPIDYQVKYVGQLWANSYYKRFFSNCARTSEYYQFSGVLGLWITQIQPTNFRDFVNNTLLTPEVIPTLQLPDPTGLPTIQMLPSASSQPIITRSSTMEGVDWAAWEGMSSGSVTSQLGVDRQVSLDPTTGEVTSDLHYRQRTQWRPDASWDTSSWHQPSDRNPPWKGKGQGKRNDDRWTHNAWNRERR